MLAVSISEAIHKIPLMLQSPYLSQELVHRALALKDHLFGILFPLNSKELQGNCHLKTKLNVLNWMSTRQLVNATTQDVWIEGIITIHSRNNQSYELIHHFSPVISFFHLELIN